MTFKNILKQIDEPLGWYIRNYKISQSRLGISPHNKGKTKENYEPVKIVSEKLTGRKKPRVKVVCKGCGLDFFVVPYMKFLKYCSRQCFNKHHVAWSKSKKIDTNIYLNWGMKGKHHSKETKSKLSKKHSGKHYSIETEFERGHKSIVYPDTYKKIGEKIRQNYKTGKMKSPKYWKDKNRTEETKEKISITRKKRIREGKIKITWKGKPRPDLSERNTKNPPLKNAESFRKWFNSFQKTIQQKPNNKEKKVDEIIQTNFPNQFVLNVKINPDIINNRIPDWVGCNSKKQVINFNGIYWHLWRQQKEEPKLTKKDVEKRESKPYEDAGYKILFIWEDELENKQQLINKINSFIKSD